MRIKGTVIVHTCEIEIKIDSAVTDDEIKAALIRHAQEHLYTIPVAYRVQDYVRLEANDSVLGKSPG